MAYYSVYTGHCTFSKLISTYDMSLVQHCETFDCGVPGLSSAVSCVVTDITMGTLCMVSQTRWPQYIWR